MGRRRWRRGVSGSGGRSMWPLKVIRYRIINESESTLSIARRFAYTMKH
jgi:hypothetical protein